MGGVTKIVSKVGDAVGDAIEDVGDAVGIGGGGGSAAPAPKPAPAPKTSPASPGGFFKDAASVTPQVVVYGPDGTAYSNPAAAEAAGVTNYTTTQPTFDQISPIRPFEPGEGGFFGGVTNATVLPEPGYTYVGAGSDPANVQPIGQQQRGQFEAATQFGLNQPAGGMQMSQTPFQRPETMARQMVEGNPFQTGRQAPLTPEQAQIFARQAAQRFAAGGPVQQGVGSLMGRMRRN